MISLFKFDLRKILDKYSSNNKIKLIDIIIITCLFITFCIFENYQSSYLEPIYKNIQNFEKSYKKSFLYTFFVEEKVSEIKKFWDANVKNQLLEDNVIKNYETKTPGISVIITTFNQANCFYKALRSVQNQSLKNIEIILVDDFSTDNSIEIMENYQKEDNRIIILKNPYNYGTIKSRSEAIKLAQGKYILIIDGDDVFATRDILFNCLTIKNIGNFDVIKFIFAFL